MYVASVGEIWGCIHIRGKDKTGSYISSPDGNLSAKAPHDSPYPGRAEPYDQHEYNFLFG
jgi:hypothetical protein